MKVVAKACRRPMLGKAACIALAAVAMVSSTGATLADRSIAMTSADTERLLAKVKAEHPNTSILKIERERQDGAAKADVYEVKLLRPDGQVLKLYYDAVTLVLLEHHADDDDKRGRTRRRERHRGQW